MTQISTVSWRAYRDTNTIDTKIAETQNSRSVCDDANRGIRIGPVPQDCSNRLALLDGNVESFGSRI